VGRRVEPLRPEAVEELPPGCRACLFWELGRPRPDARTDDPADELAGDPAVQKQAWHTAAGLEDGAAGRVVRVDDRLAGYVLFAPPGRFAPRRPPVPGVSEDALFLATLWVDPLQRDGGIGRLLLHAAVKEAIARELAAVEVYGDRRFREADCVLPTMWLLHEGFEVHREHPRYPLLRLETRRTVRWTEALGDAVEGILGRVRPDPERAPAPAPHTSATRPTPEAGS
jgi:GNAT superfamily N-acetyltransferase